MTPEAWGALATIGSATATALGIWGAARAGAAKTEARAARKAAENAADNSWPTANGYADETRTALATLTAAVDRIERRQAAESIARTKTAELLAEHLADHARAGIDRR